MVRTWGLSRADKELQERSLRGSRAAHWGPRAVPTGDHSGLGGEDGEALTVQLIM